MALKRFAMVVRDDGYDKILTPLAFAYVTAASGTEVDMLFVNWAVRALTRQGSKEIRMDGQHADAESAVREQVRAAGMPSEIDELLQALKGTGKVNFYACSLAASIFGVKEADLLPECSGIVGADWFINEKAATADHFESY
jgi:peroxiredoxin family protein